MGEIAFKLLCMHRTLRLNKITQCWVSDGGWMLETVPRGDRQRENLVHPKTVPPGETKPDTLLRQRRPAAAIFVGQNL